MHSIPRVLQLPWMISHHLIYLTAHTFVNPIKICDEIWLDQRILLLLKMTEDD